MSYVLLVCSCVTMSKPWGACGVTIGWLVSPNLSAIEKLKDVQYFGTACPSRASEIQAIMVLKSSDKILERNLKIINENKVLLNRFMEKFKEYFTWNVPDAGATCFIDCLPLSSAILGAELAEVGIGVKPAYCFCEEVYEEIEGYFRVGYGERGFKERLEKLEEFVEGKREEGDEILKNGERRR